VESVLEGLPLPAGRREILEYARAEGLEGDLLAELGRRLGSQQYPSLDAIGEELVTVQPTRRRLTDAPPAPESGDLPGHDAYVTRGGEPGAAREFGS
jgi:hypothetical protein